MVEKEGIEKRQQNEVDETFDQAKLATEEDSSPRTTVPDLKLAGFAMPTTDYVPGSDTEPTGDTSRGEVKYESFHGSIGRYQCKGTLGTGAFGAVLRAWDPELEVYRAVKVPHRELIDSGRVNPESYVKEARKVAQLGNHDGIVNVLDVQRMEDGLPFVVSEYISGGDLSNWVKTHQLPWKEATRIVAEVADAMAFAHSKGVVHRDLKPANILMTVEGKPVVGDFGLALDDNEFSYRETVCGTFRYMSPEQLQGKADRVDGRADIYSLGVILFELLANRSPYRSREPSSLKREVIEGGLPPVRQYASHIPEQLEAICKKALATDPEQRFTTASDLAESLRAVSTEEPASEAAAAVPPSSVPWIAAIAGAALIIAAAAFFMRSRSSSDLAPVVPPIPTTIDADLEVHLQKADEKGTYRGVMSRGDLPLQVGDKIQFHVTLAKPGFVYVYWIDFHGKATRQWPDPAISLSDQQPIAELHSPPKSDGENAQWWEVAETGGPEVILLGVSEHPLSKEQLEEVEASTQSLASLLGDQRLLCEFEFPKQTHNYIKVDGNFFVTRGAGKNPVVSPKTIPNDHSLLSKLFSEYQGWVFATE